MLMCVGHLLTLPSARSTDAATASKAKLSIGSTTLACISPESIDLGSAAQRPCIFETINGRLASQDLSGKSVVVVGCGLVRDFPGCVHTGIESMCAVRPPPAHPKVSALFTKTLITVWSSRKRMLPKVARIPYFKIIEVACYGALAAAVFCIVPFFVGCEEHATEYACSCS